MITAGYMDTTFHRRTDGRDRSRMKAAWADNNFQHFLDFDHSLLISYNHSFKQLPNHNIGERVNHSGEKGYHSDSMTC